MSLQAAGAKKGLPDRTTENAAVSLEGEEVRELTPQEMREKITKGIEEVGGHLAKLLADLDKSKDQVSPMVSGVLQASNTYLELLVVQTEQFRTIPWGATGGAGLRQFDFEADNALATETQLQINAWDRLRKRISEIVAKKVEVKDSKDLLQLASRVPAFKDAEKEYARLKSVIRKQRNFAATNAVESFREEFYHPDTRDKLFSFISIQDPMILWALEVTHTTTPTEMRFGNTNGFPAPGGSGSGTGNPNEKSPGASKSSSSTANGKPIQTKYSKLMEFLLAFQSRAAQALVPANGFTEAEIVTAKEALFEGITGMSTRVLGTPDILVLDLQKSLLINKIKQSFDQLEYDPQKQKLVGELYVVLAFGTRVFSRDAYKKLSEAATPATPPKQP